MVRIGMRDRHFDYSAEWIEGEALNNQDGTGIHQLCYTPIRPGSLSIYFPDTGKTVKYTETEDNFIIDHKTGAVNLGVITFKEPPLATYLYMSENLGKLV